MKYEPRLHIVLHQPEIPGNTGAVGRTCLALEAKLWLVRPLGFQVDEKSLRRAGLDYWQHLEWEVVDSWEDLLSRSDDLGQPGTGGASLGASTDAAPRHWMFTRTASRNYIDVRYAIGDWLVFGSETSGLSPSLLTDEGRNLRIPVSEHVRSLNLSAAVAIAGFEHARQTGYWNAASHVETLGPSVADESTTDV